MRLRPKQDPRRPRSSTGQPQDQPPSSLYPRPPPDHATAAPQTIGQAACSTTLYSRQFLRAYLSGQPYARPASRPCVSCGRPCGVPCGFPCGFHGSWSRESSVRVPTCG